MDRFIMLKLLLLSLAVAVNGQLAPVYNPGGVPVQETVEARSAAIADIEIKPTAAHLPRAAYVTKTVYGFLDFTTTVGSTVMIFTPQSQAPKPKPSKTRESPFRPSRFTLPPSRPKPKPTPTIPQLIATPAPTSKIQSVPVHSSTTVLESSFFEPQTALAIENLFSVTPDDYYEDEVENIEEPPHTQNVPEESAKVEHPDAKSPRKPFRRPNKPFDLPPGLIRRHQKRPDPIYYPDHKKSISANHPRGGSTIVPITIEGTGTFSPRYSDTERLQESPIVPTPSEVVVSATQGFATLSVIGPFNTDIANDLGEVSEHYDFLASEPPLDVTETYDVYEVEPTASLEVLYSSDFVTADSSFPTGLVTKLGGTIVSDGLTTVHETRVIAPGGRGRDSRRTEEEEKLIKMRLQSALSKRRGANQELPSHLRPHADEDDPYLDLEDEDDLQRAGSDLRASFRFNGATSVRPVSTFYAQQVKPTTFRRTFKPATSRRFGNSRTSSSRPTLLNNARNRFRHNNQGSKVTRRPLGQRNRPRLPEKQIVEESNPDPIYFPEDDYIDVIVPQEETLQIATSTPLDGPSDVYYEMATIRSLHTFRVGTTKNTRMVTFTKTFTHTIDPTPIPSLPEDELYQTQQLFENILDDRPSDVSTLPPIDIGENDVAALLETITETFSTTELMMKTSVLPVLYAGETSYYSLTQTYHITRVVTAMKTMPPLEAFSFIPENSLNEFNDQLLAEGTETGQSLQPGELEYDENGEVVDTSAGIRVRPPPGFPFQDPNLADLAAGSFNVDAFEKQTNPQLAAALQQRQQLQQQQQQQLQLQQQQPSFGIPQLASGQQSAPIDPAIATPGLTPEQMQQLAYLRLLSNPYGFGSFPPPLPQQQQQTTITSSPVTITTDIVTTSTRVLRVIFNARPIFTTLSSVETVHTTLTTFTTQTVTLSPNLSPFAFPFAGGAFPVG